MSEWTPKQDDATAGSTDNSRLLDPPETPAPIFALRAFKSALFGTPGEEEEGKEDQVTSQTGQNDIQKLRETAGTQSTGEQQNDGKAEETGDLQPPMHAISSPTKSILVTPGATSNRRKTVSFGDSVLSNERRKDASVAKAAKMQPPSPASVSSQWPMGQPEGKIRVRSKLTQSLLDARENAVAGLPRIAEPVKLDKKSPKETEGFINSMKSEGMNDETTNLNEPRSQSGQYWKAEFDSYRKRTNREMRKLIQYRSVAKSYARKKDAEALRLAEKLREEEAKVAEMERHVSNLASSMLAGDADKEKLVQELTKQTTMALQYKHKANSLRKALERHGVVGSSDDQLDGNLPSEKTIEELRKTQKALEDANSRIEDMKHQQTDLKRLQELAQSSERKALELDKENYSLKQKLARFKQEMTMYEDRRKEKEARLKQREAKLEMRNQEYRERLKSTTRERREAEDALKYSFHEERIRMQEQIDLLRSRITSMERSPRLGKHEEPMHRPQNSYTRTHLSDAELDSHYGAGDIPDFRQPRSPSSQSRRRHQRRLSITGPGSPEQRKGIKAEITEQNQYEESLGWPHRPPSRSRRRSLTLPFTSTDMSIIPSPPLGLPPGRPASMIVPDNIRFEQPYDRGFISLHPTMVTFPAKVGDNSKHRVHRGRQRNPVMTVASESMFVHRSPSIGASSYTPPVPSPARSHSRGSLATIKRDAMSVDRVVAAKTRLKQKEKNRRSVEEGKENTRVFDD